MKRFQYITIASCIAKHLINNIYTTDQRDKLTGHCIAVVYPGGSSI